MQYALIRFLDAGFRRVSVDELTSDLAMSKRTFYRIFDSKEDLVGQLALPASHDCRGTIQAGD